MRMIGWVMPPPKRPSKTKEEFEIERRKKVAQLRREGILRSETLVRAMLEVPREEFIREDHRDYAYHGSTYAEEIPLPIPGENATISCPHAYPLFYEPLEIREGDRFLEIGMGSGYGVALAREVTGSKGKVVGVEIDEVTYEFGRGNLQRVRYSDIITVLGDGSYGYEKESPYDRISLTAACREFPHDLFNQLKVEGKMIAPIGSSQFQELVLLRKISPTRIRTEPLGNVLFIPLRGKCSPTY
jgi:protein-L-isoaspartate(D-aspartate) O-methyltransferase